jgi:hypothetical protein
VIQRRRRARFALEPLERLPITPQRRQQEFEGDAPAEPSVFCFVHDTHPAATERPNDVVV